MIIKTNALTDKGNVRPAVRTAIVKNVDENRDVFKEAVKVSDSLYTLTATDTNGETIYINFKVTVGTTNGADYATKTKTATSAETIEVE